MLLTQQPETLNQMRENLAFHTRQNPLAAPLKTPHHRWCFTAMNESPADSKSSGNWTILWLLIFYPFGILKLWSEENFDDQSKRLLTGVFGAIFGVWFFKLGVDLTFYDLCLLLFLPFAVVILSRRTGFVKKARISLAVGAGLLLVFRIAALSSGERYYPAVASISADARPTPVTTTPIASRPTVEEPAYVATPPIATSPAARKPTHPIVASSFNPTKRVRENLGLTLDDFISAFNANVEKLAPQDQHLLIQDYDLHAYDAASATLEIKYKEGVMFHLLFNKSSRMVENIYVMIGGISNEGDSTIAQQRTQADLANMPPVLLATLASDMDADQQREKLAALIGAANQAAGKSGPPQILSYGEPPKNFTMVSDDLGGYVLEVTTKN